MDLLELLQWLINGTLDLFLHAAWSGLASLLAFSLTYWGSRWLYSLLATLLHSPTSIGTRLERAILRFGFSAALFASFTVHLWWDRLLGPF